MTTTTTTPSTGSDLSLRPWIFPVHTADFAQLSGITENYPIISVKPIGVTLNMTLLEQIRSVINYRGGAFSSISFLISAWDEPVDGSSFAFPMQAVSDKMLAGGGDGWSANGMEQVNKITDFLRRDPILIPNFTQVGTNDLFSINAKFTMFNTDEDAVAKNFKYILNLIRLNTQATGQASSTNTPSTTGTGIVDKITGTAGKVINAVSNYQRLVPPCLFVVLIPGIAWIPACKCSFVIKPSGVCRKFTGTASIKSDNGAADMSLTGRGIPDAWIVDLTFTSLVPMKKEFFELGNSDVFKVPASTGYLGTLAASPNWDMDIAGGKMNLVLPTATNSALTSSVKKAVKILSDGTVCDEDAGTKSTGKQKPGTPTAKYTGIYSGAVQQIYGA